MKDQMIFKKILNETKKIQWEVNRVEKNVLMVKNITEKIFRGER